MTAALVYGVDHGSFSDVSAADLAEIEPSLTWQREAPSGASSMISFSVRGSSFVAAAYSASGVCYGIVSILGANRAMYGQKAVGRGTCEASLFRTGDFSKKNWT